LTVLRRQAWRRWGTVAAAALLLAALPVAARALPAHAPAVSPADLVARVRASARQPYQGYAISRGTAGLPTLPQLAEVSRLLAGETQLRAWYAGPDRWRVDTIDTGAERDVYQTADLQVQWDFGANQLTAVTGTAPVRLPRGADLLPPDLGRRLLGAGDSRLDPLPARRIAGISAAGVRLTPTDPSTTIGRVDVWADPASGLPLQVEVTARGAALPVLVTRFLELRLSAPSPAILVPPHDRPGLGFTVTDAPDIAGAVQTLRLGPLPLRLAGRDRADAPLIAAGGRPRRGIEGTGVYGTGFNQFVVLPVPRQNGFAAFRTAVNGGGTQLELPGGEGVAISTGLVSVLVMDSDLAHRTYVLAGLVKPTVLAEAAVQLSTYAGRR
jgi:hypothetical protein